MRKLHKLLALLLAPLLSIWVMIVLTSAVCIALISFFYELMEELRQEWDSFRNDQNTEHYRSPIRQWVKLWRCEYVKERDE